MKRIIVCGSRDWTDDFSELTEALEQVFCLELNLCDPVFVHGASGCVDLGVEEWAISNFDWRVERFKADWDKHGKAAGPIRNREMAKAGADLCVAFWDGKSRGTLSMITEAVMHGIPVRIVPKEKR